MYSEIKMAVADDLLLERLTVRESQLAQQADALDVKASILLVAITFLAGQSTFFLINHAAGCIHWEQVLAVVVEIGSGILLAKLLRLQRYDNEAAEDYPKWRNELLNEFVSNEGNTEDIKDRMTSEIIADLATECRDAYDKNNQKALLLKRAYWLVIASLALNFIALGLFIVHVK